MRPYPIPAEATCFTEEIKKSRFITLLAPTSGVEAAKAFIQQVRDEHPAARHHCWAFVAGSPMTRSNWVLRRRRAVGHRRQTDPRAADGERHR